MPATSSTTAVVLLGLPPKVLVGIDLLSFTPSPTFRGIRNIPSGAHFLYTGADASLSIRHGYWFCIPSSRAGLEPELLIWRWDTEEECLVPESDGQIVGAVTSELLRASTPPQSSRGFLDYESLLLLQATGGLQNGSGGQPRSGGGEEEEDTTVTGWADLANYISDPVLNRILASATSEGSSVQTAAAPQSRVWHISSVSSAPRDAEHIPGLTSSETHLTLGDPDLKFLPVDLKKTWRDGAVGRERTESALDRSWYLRSLIDRFSTGRHWQGTTDRSVGAAQILGEMQFCFLAVLTLANWSCLEQWKRVLGVLLSCRTAVGEVPEYFVAVVRLLRFQMEHCEDVEGGLFEFREEGSGAWLRGLLVGFKKGVEDVFGDGGGEALKEELSRLEDFMRETYGWEVHSALLRRGMLDLEDGERVEMEMEGADEEDEMGEYAPVVVELG